MDFERARRLTAETFEQSIIPRLCDYIRIPNKSPLFDAEWQAHGHMDRAAELMASWCREQPIKGLKVEIVRAKGRTPVLFCEIPGSGTDTVLLYGHMDKQPEFTGWIDGLSPWEPVLRDGKLYGRGGADDGYAAFASLTALRALQDQGVPHARCVVLIEACEESGSTDLPAYIELLKPRLGTPGLIVCLDSGCGNYEQLWATTSLRGIAAGTLTVEVLGEGVHSGDASGIVPSSFRILRQLLARVEDGATGRVLLPELFVDVPDRRRAQSAAAAQVLAGDIHAKFPFVPGCRPMHSDPVELMLNRTWRPALSVTGALLVRNMFRFVDGLPMLYVVVLVSFVIPVVVEERRFGTAALKRSVALSRYNARLKFFENPPVKILALFLVGWLLSYAVNTLVQLPIMVAQQILLVREIVGGQAPDPQALFSEMMWFQVPSAVLTSLATTAITLYTSFGLGLLFHDIRRRREGVDLTEALDALGAPVAQREDVAVAGEVLVLEYRRAPLGADRRGLVVVHLEQQPVGQALLDPEIQDALPGAESRAQLRIEPLDARILLQELQARLQLEDVERWAGAQLQAPPQEPVPEPSRPRDVDARELALDDLVRHDAVADRLIGQDRPGIDEPGVDVVQRQRDLARVEPGGRRQRVHRRQQHQQRQQAREAQEEDRQGRDDPVGDFARALTPVPLDHAREDRHEGRRQRALAEQAAEGVRDRPGPDQRVADGPRAQQGGRGLVAHQPQHARQHGEHRDRARRVQEVPRRVRRPGGVVIDGGHAATTVAPHGAGIQRSGATCDPVRTARRPALSAPRAPWPPSSRALRPGWRRPPPAPRRAW